PEIIERAAGDIPRIQNSFLTYAYLISLIKILYENTATQVIRDKGGHLTALIAVCLGMKNNCALIPLLFNIFAAFGSVTVDKSGLSQAGACFKKKEKYHRKVMEYKLRTYGVPVDSIVCLEYYAQAKKLMFQRLDNIEYQSEINLLPQSSRNMLRKILFNRSIHAVTCQHASFLLSQCTCPCDFRKLIEFNISFYIRILEVTLILLSILGRIDNLCFYFLFLDSNNETLTAKLRMSWVWWPASIEL
ncbi:hypothetical protein L345_07010, partial [Ophiophagus hannah]